MLHEHNFVHTSALGEDNIMLSKFWVYCGTKVAGILGEDWYVMFTATRKRSGTKICRNSRVGKVCNFYRNQGTIRDKKCQKFEGRKSIMFTTTWTHCWTKSGRHLRVGLVCNNHIKQENFRDKIWRKYEGKKCM